MASVVAKLYPPTIDSSIPAFYNDNGTVKITVPFSMNKAINVSDIKGLSLKIKTVQSNTYLTTLFCENSDFEEAINTNIATFIWSDFNSDNTKEIKVGQFLKVQLAYQGSSGVGYYSTVGITKFTSKPKISIQNMEIDEIEAEPIYKKSYVGLYEMTEDKTERPYSYIFNLYDMNRILVETSNWKLHNSSLSSASTEYSSLSQSLDFYTFTSSLKPNSEYYIQYGVKTLNNLEIYSPLYVCMQIENIDPEITANLIAENIFDDGYIQLYLNPYSSADDYAPGSYIISRAEDKDNFENWEVINKVTFYKNDKLSDWSFKDFIVEQGIQYQYSIQQYNNVGIYTDKIKSNKVLCDFEDVFLFDGLRQLKIRLNPKVSSFKTTLLEQKTNTIGSKYPFFFRNGNVAYKEFSISGLISYLSDNNELFLDYEDDLDIVQSDLKRDKTESLNIDNLKVPTTQLIDYNIKAERIFKLFLLDWLNDGKVKLFKSSVEGNYLVRLTNVSLSPEDRTSRMLHNFSCQASEIQEINYDNLVDLGFIDLNEKIEDNYMEETILFSDFLDQMNENNFLKLNSYPIYEYFSIIGAIPGAKIRLGSMNSDNIVMIGSNGSLSMNIVDSLLPNVYICAEDNEDESLLVAASLTYKYRTNGDITSKFKDVKNLLVKNEVATFCGDYNFEQLLTGNIKESLLKFFVLNFSKKPIVELDLINGSYFISDSENKVNYFDERTLYKIEDQYYKVENGSLITIENIDYSVTINEDVFIEPPQITLPQEKYDQIIIGNGVVVDCAYQKKITQYLIEDTDTDLMRISNKFSPEYISLLEEKLNDRG